MMFVPYTPYSELARRMRESEEKMEGLTGYKLKIVERAGMKIVDLLHASNPWRGQNCERKDCLLCSTKKQTGRKKSNVVENEVLYTKYGAEDAKRRCRKKSRKKVWKTRKKENRLRC